MSELPPISQSELEAKDPRAELLIPGPKEPLFGVQRREFEKQIACAQIFDLTLHPDGRILGRPSNLFIPEDRRRLEWEDTETFMEVNPRQYEVNLMFERAISNLMEGKSSGLENPISVPQTRVAFGVCYSYKESETGEEKIVFRVNNDPNNRYRNCGNTLSGLVKLIPSQAHPGELLRQSYEEVVPVRLGPEGKINPYFPAEYGGVRSRAYQEYKAKALALSEISAGADSVAAYQALLTRDPFRLDRPSQVPSAIRAHFKTMPFSTPISFEFPKDEKGEVKKQTHLIAAFNPVGSLEFAKVIQIDKPDRLYDPEFGSTIVVVSQDELAAYADRILRNTGLRSLQENGQLIESPPEIKVDQLIDGKTGLPLPKEESLGFDPEKMTLFNFRMSPNLWPVAKFLYDRKSRDD